ncbi:uncharacterized protein N7496_002486 [Penicillium cataractarum]|uniref:SnoaL-like domain-containing protein n=1 Tax=Penicillium cataractarum TaxID=2100454 RepID=A0A9W9SK64_9EURO|nr:uncharacterized protein N7496_002486 [Penicillium cataractarum]KAJ5380058.1 hypothetical protein N7496_002486 [Penicillium cataractarum]
MAPFTHNDFLEYVKSFNAKDFDKQYSFYHDDITLDIPDPQTGILRGKAGIRNHYLPLFDVADEYIVPMVIMVDGERVFYIMESSFRYNKRLDEGGVFGFKVDDGDVIKIRVWAYYEIREGKFQSIVCNLFQKWFLGKVDMKEAIRESQSRATEGLRHVHICD